jgi:hypothetical protein
LNQYGIGKRAVDCAAESAVAFLAEQLRFQRAANAVRNNVFLCEFTLVTAKDA